MPWDIRKMSCSRSIEKRNRTMALLLTNSMTWTSFLTFPSLKYVIYNGAVVLRLCGLFWCYLLSVIPCEKGALSEYFCQTVWIHYLYSSPVNTVKYIFMISKMSKWARKNLVGAIYLVVSTSQTVLDTLNNKAFYNLKKVECSWQYYEVLIVNFIDEELRV